MRLLRVGNPGAERPAMLDNDGRLRDLSAHVSDIDAESLGSGVLDRLRGLDPAKLPEIGGAPRIGACVGRVGNFIAVGLNYAAHAAEANLPVPAEPVLFNKAPSSICGPDDDIVLPPESEKCDWEIELAVVIGRPAYRIGESEVRDSIAGYCICNDVSERAFQTERGGQWMKGKSAPTFGPLGPWLVTPDEVPDVQALGLDLRVNGTRMQHGTTADMIFGVTCLVSYVSQFMRLMPGDVITTGTPSGIGHARRQPFTYNPGTGSNWLFRVLVGKATGLWRGEHFGFPFAWRRAASGSWNCIVDGVGLRAFWTEGGRTWRGVTTPISLAA